MKTERYYAIIACMIFLLTVFMLDTVSAAELADPRNIKFPELAFRIPKPERIVLENGIPVYLLQDHDQPIVSVTTLLRTGSVYDPPGKSGLSAMTGALLRGGGTTQLSPEKLDDELDFMASGIESSFDSDLGKVSMSTLSRNLEKTLGLYSDVILRPAFDPARLEIARQHAIESIRRKNDDPKELADRELNRVINEGHPLGIMPTDKSVLSITREDLLSFHKRFVTPRNLIISVSGDFDRNRMISTLNRLFGSVAADKSWKLPELPEAVADSQAGVFLFPKEISQSVIRLGHIGITKDDPDLYAIRVLNFILGGSFTSRLMMEVRTNQGLAYHIASDFRIGRLFQGAFTAGTETKAESTAKTIGLISSIISGIRSAPVSEQEIELARQSIINSFIFGFTTPAVIANQYAQVELFGYPADYLEKYRDNISRLTRDDLLKAAKKHLHPDKLKIVVVGNQARFDLPLSTFGKVVTTGLQQ